MPVRSNLLYAGSVTGTSEVVLYTPPAGYRTIVKGLQLRNSASVSQLVLFRIKSGATLKSTFSVNLSAQGASGESAILEVWFVLPDGYSLAVQMPNTSGAYVTVSGAELLNV